MFDDDTIQHPEQEEESTYTPEQAIRKDFELLFESILTACTQPWSNSTAPVIDWPFIAETVINLRLSLYERAGLLRASEPMTEFARDQLNSLGSE